MAAVLMGMKMDARVVQVTRTPYMYWCGYGGQKLYLKEVPEIIVLHDDLQLTMTMEGRLATSYCRVEMGMSKGNELTFHKKNKEIQ